MDNVRARTPIFLQDALATEIERLAEGMEFYLPPSGEKRGKLQVFRQNLPIPQRPKPDEQLEDDTIDIISGDVEDPIFQCPWGLVKFEGGSVKSPNDRMTIKVAIAFGIFNAGTSNEGHIEILNLINRVYERFAKNPVLASQYTCSGQFDFGLQDEDTHPYYFGAISTEFSYLGYQREDCYGIT